MNKMWLQMWLVAICALLVVGLAVGYFLRDAGLLLPGTIVSVDVRVDGSVVHVKDPEVLNELETALTQTERRGLCDVDLYNDVISVNYSDGRTCSMVVEDWDQGLVYISHGWYYEAPEAESVARELLQAAEDLAYGKEGPGRWVRTSVRSAEDAGVEEAPEGVSGE